jgi:hypothetical protein
MSSERSTCEEFGLGSRELFVAQYTTGMQVGELLQLGRQIILGRRRGQWGCILGRGRRHLLLLRLGVSSTLLIGLIILLLGSCILLGIFLLLVVTDRAGRTGDNCRGDRGPGYGSSNHSSSHHIDLFSLL